MLVLLSFRIITIVINKLELNLAILYCIWYHFVILMDVLYRKKKTIKNIKCKKF